MSGSAAYTTLKQYDHRNIYVIENIKYRKGLDVNMIKKNIFIETIIGLIFYKIVFLISMTTHPL